MNATIHTDPLKTLDSAHHLHPFTDHKALGNTGARIITRADGVYLWDSDGNKLLDGMAGLWCVNVGYGRKELVAAASAQLSELPYYNNFFQCTHPPAVELAALLAEVSPASLNRVFFTNSGSEANDTVLRMVRRYFQVIGQPQRQIVISRWNAYHGSTVASASLGGMKPMHEQGGLPIPDIEHIEQPYWFKLGGQRTPQDFGLEAARWLDQRITELGAHRVAAFIGEPVQGAGGVIVPPESYWPEIARICRKHGVLLVSDEVICGFGRTGRWFGCQHYGVTPDLMPIAKGLSSGYLPIGGVMVSDHVADALIENGGEFFHGFTYSGHPACAAVAAANVRIIRDEGLVERVQNDIGPYFKQQLSRLLELPLVGEIRCLGLMAGIQLCADPVRRTLFSSEGDVGNACRDYALEAGLVMRATGDTMILSPPLTITHEQVDELVEKAADAVARTGRQVLGPRFPGA